MLKTITTILISLCLVAPASTQPDSLTWEEQFAQLEAEMDSLSIFFLIDSILQSTPRKYSELNTRMGYNSNVLSAGRNFGINQHSISPGAAFYHSSGIYADYSGFWNTETSPKYNLSIFTLGYLGAFSKTFSYTAGYERWWYHASAGSNLNNSLGTTLTYRNRYGYAAIDYSFLFGESSAHRVIGSIIGSISLGKWRGLQSARLLPSFSTYFGNALVTTRFDGNILEEFRSNEYLRENLGSDEFLAYAREVLTEEEKQQLMMIQANQNLDRDQKRRRRQAVYLSNTEVQAYIYDILDETNEKYGIMNYSLSLPLMLTSKRFSFILSYTYSIPVKLPGETFALDPVGYFGASVGYRIPFN